MYLISMISEHVMFTIVQSVYFSDKYVYTEEKKIFNND